MIVAFDPVRFTLRAVLDSADVTAMRTASIAAVAARRRAGPGPHSVAVIGTGPIGRHSLAALDVREIRLWSRERSRAGQFAATLQLPASVCGSPDEAAAGAGVVLTATPSREPLLLPEASPRMLSSWPWARIREASGN